MRKTLHEFEIHKLGWIETERSENVAMNELTSVFDASVGLVKYAKLTNRAPKLGDFVPCDEDGNVLDDPMKDVNMTIVKFIESIGGIKKYNKHPMKELHMQYQQALGRVIFKGDWEVIHEGENAVQIVDSGREFSFRYSKKTKEFTLPKINRIEDLPREIEFKEGVI